MKAINLVFSFLFLVIGIIEIGLFVWSIVKEPLRVDGIVIAVGCFLITSLLIKEIRNEKRNI